MVGAQKLMCARVTPGYLSHNLPDGRGGLAPFPEGHVARGLSGERGTAGGIGPTFAYAARLLHGGPTLQTSRQITLTFWAEGPDRLPIERARGFTCALPATRTIDDHRAAAVLDKRELGKRPPVPVACSSLYYLKLQTEVFPYPCFFLSPTRTVASPSLDPACTVSTNG